MIPSWLKNVPPRVMGMLQLTIFVMLIYIGSFGGVLLGFLPPALIIGGKGINNLFTQSR